MSLFGGCPSIAANDLFTQQHLMQTITISKTYTLIWSVKDAENYKVSKCGKVFNCQRGKEIKRCYVSGTVGYCINSKFTSLKNLRTKLIKIKNETLPF